MTVPPNRINDKVARFDGVVELRDHETGKLVEKISYLDMLGRAACGHIEAKMRGKQLRYLQTLEGFDYSVLEDADIERSKEKDKYKKQSVGSIMTQQGIATYREKLYEPIIDRSDPDHIRVIGETDNVIGVTVSFVLLRPSESRRVQVAA